jgi:hypothetical protein
VVEHARRDAIVAADNPIDILHERQQLIFLETFPDGRNDRVQPFGGKPGAIASNSFCRYGAETSTLKVWVCFTQRLLRAVRL